MDDEKFKFSMEFKDKKVGYIYHYECFKMVKWNKKPVAH